MEIAPEAIITVTALGNEAVDMRVPFQVPAEGVEDHDKAGSEVHGFIEVQEHTGNDAGDGMEETIEERAVIEEEISKLRINSKDTVAVDNVDQLKGHRGSAAHSVEISTSRAETAVASEGNKFELTTMGAAIHGTTKRGISTAQHLIDIFYLSISGMKGIFNFFIMVVEDFL